jgi:4-amino-4-deoxy-L-arabinose transferase-like glycosyltransferase
VDPTEASTPAVHRRTFAVGLALIALLGLGVRISFAATREPDPLMYDAAFYKGEAEILASGGGFTDPFLYELQGRAGEAAHHPPLTALVLTPVAWFGGNATAMRLTFAVLGSGTVVLVGVLGAAVAGRRVGLVAAGIAAVYPFLWINDGVIMAESLAVLLTTAALVGVFALLRRPTWWRAAALGAGCGLAALARAELLLLGLLLAVGLVLRPSEAMRSRRIAFGAVVVATMLLVVSPWVVFNLTRFEEPVFMTTDGEVNLLFSTCDATFHGPALGDGSWACLLRDRKPAADHSIEAKEFRHVALRYTRDHLARYPVVVAARLGRIWSLFRPTHAVMDFEGRPSWAMGLGLAFYYPLLALAVAGVVVLHRRRRVWWPFVVPPLVVCSIALVSWGQTRYRATAEPCIAVLAAVALTAAFEAVRERRARIPAEATI